MGTFSYPVEVAASREGPFEPVEALVDTGSLYTWLPRAVFDRLDVKPSGKRRFQTADGRIVNRNVAELVIRIDGETATTICVLGDPGDQVLLGAYALEGVSMAADPVNERLVPMPSIPAARGQGR
jgi:clan AA aspartic protease